MLNIENCGSLNNKRPRIESFESGMVSDELNDQIVPPPSKLLKSSDNKPQPVITNQSEEVETLYMETPDLNSVLEAVDENLAQ